MYSGPLEGYKPEQYIRLFFASPKTSSCLFQEILPPLEVHAVATCLPALLANSADCRHLLHVLLALCPSLLLTFSKYAALG